jgi:endonuclease V-like protein UPF0215 family
VSLVKFRNIKKEIRILGIENGPLHLFDLEQIPLFGIVYRGGCWFDGIMQVKVTKNGLDATEKISEMIRTSPHYQQLRVIMLHGIFYAGFNTVNIKQLFSFTGLPIISLTSEEPNFHYMKKALRMLPQWKKRWKNIEDAGEVIRFTRDHSKLFLQIVGLRREDAETIISISSNRSNIPEPLRVANIIASGFFN